MSTVTVTGVLIEQPNLKVHKWIKYTMGIYIIQTLYLVSTNIDSDDLYLWSWITLHYFIFGLFVPMIGDYGAKKPHWPSLSCFSGAQSMVGVLNSITLIAAVCSVTTLHSLCSECHQTFASGNETCFLPFRNKSKIFLTKSWCDESPINYAIPTFLMCVNIYVSFMSAFSARKMGQTKKIQVVTIDSVPIVQTRQIPSEEQHSEQV